MIKNILERFITKYNLSGAADKVTWKSTKDGVSTRFISDDKNVIGEISNKDIQLDVGEYHIYETTQLKNLLGVLGDEVSIKVQNEKSKNTGLTFSDKSTKATFVLAEDATNIPGVPALKSLPEFNVVINMDKSFMERFIRAKGALADVDTFAVTGDGKTTSVVLGFSERDNTNRVSIECAVSSQSKIVPIHFHARYLRDLLVANKEAEVGKLEVSSEGLARITFELTDFDVKYYLPQIPVEE